MTMLLPRQTEPTALTGRRWQPRSDTDLLIAQLDALEKWHRLVGAAPVTIPGQNREDRLDETRHRDLADRERAALHAWAERTLREPASFGAGQRPRAVVAHRGEWLREKVCAGLLAGGVEVVASTGDGAEASAAVVLEQPDIVFLEDLLPTLSGVELVWRAWELAPAAVVGTHALGPGGMTPLLEAGARATFSRRIPPAEIAAELVACLHGHRTRVTLI